ncbi:MAG: GtrA family protein [Burkholderiaceae bacterium]
MSVEFIYFLFVGTIGFLVDGGGTSMLVHLGVLPIAARIGPLLLAIVVTWSLNRKLTFKVKRPRSRAELTRYLLVAMSSAVMNLLFYSALVTVGVASIAAVAVATLVLFLYSFFAYRRLVFR